MTVVVSLIHAHVHPTMTMVHVDTIIMMGLVPHRYDRGYSPRIDYSSDRDYRNHPPDRDDNNHIRQHSPSYYGRRYDNSNGFSPVRNYCQDCYPNQNHSRQGQGRYQGGNQGSNPNRYNNEGNGGSQLGRKGQNRQPQQNHSSNQPKLTYGRQQPAYCGNDCNIGRHQ